MDGYVCLKPLTLSGVNYLPGSHIPVGAVLPDRVRALEKMGYIAEQNNFSPVNEEFNTPENTFHIPILTDGEITKNIPVNEENAVLAAIILQLAAEQALEKIKAVENETALILLRSLDSRKTVKNAASARIKTLHADTEDDIFNTENGPESGETG